MIPPGTRVHFVGIGGVGMSAIAAVLLARGYPVSGSDLRESEATRRLRALGAAVRIGHAAEHVAPGQVVVTSRAVPEDNVEIQAAQARGLPIVHRGRMLADLMEEGRAVAVAGTHGKTTTTAMLGAIFEGAGWDPTVLVGGDVDAFGGNVRIGAGPDVIAEVDESDGSLLWVSPQAAVVTNLDATDHLDFYGSEARLVETFRLFVDRLPADGVAAVCVDAPSGRAASTGVRPRVVTYAVETDATYTARIVEEAGRRTVFDALRGPAVLGRVTLGVPGAYNIQNALGALAAATELGVPFAAAAQALGGFRGVRRRFTVCGEVDGVLVVDDYAHNPTKVAALLAGARRAWPGARIVAVFQPHRYTRTQTVGSQFARAFDRADEVIVTEIYPADERPIPGVDAGIILRAVAPHRPVRYVANAGDVAAALAGELGPGDLVLTIGAGDVWQVAQDLVARLGARPARPSPLRSEGASPPQDLRPGGPAGERGR